MLCWGAAQRRREREERLVTRIERVESRKLRLGVLNLDSIFQNPILPFDISVQVHPATKKLKKCQKPAGNLRYSGLAIDKELGPPKVLMTKRKRLSACPLVECVVRILRMCPLAVVAASCFVTTSGTPRASDIGAWRTFEN